MILISVSLCLVSLYLSILAAYYQHCYRETQTFDIRVAISYIRRSSLSCIVFALLYLGVCAFLLCFRENMELSSVGLIQYALFWEGLALGAWIDFKVKKIPNPLFLILLAVRCTGLVAEMVFYTEGMITVLLDAFGGMFLGGLIVLICRLLSRGGIGAGDVKLFGILGFYFGIIATMNILFYTTFISAISAAFLLITRKAQMKTTLAFGPFALVGVSIYYVLLSIS